MILSIIFPGLGQIYNKQTSRGIVLAILGAIMVYGAVSGARIARHAGNFERNTSIIVYIIIWAASLYDTNETNKRIREGITDRF